MTPSPWEDLPAIISVKITGMVTPPGPLRPHHLREHAQRWRA